MSNMSTECGVTTSVFPSDTVTKAFLKAQGREADWIEIKLIIMQNMKKLSI
jgi:aconitate hydratase